MSALFLPVVVLILLAGGITAAYVAAFRIGSSRLRTLREEGFGGAETLDRVRRRTGLVAAGAQTVAGACSLAALGTGIVGHTFTLGDGPAWADALVGVLVVVMFGHVVPHVLAARYPVRIALSSAGLLLTISRVVVPLARRIIRLEEAVGGGNGHDEASAGERELREIHDIGREEGIIEEAESRLVERAFRLDELTARDVMVPRVDMFSWQADLTTGDVHPQLANVPFSRIPVFGESIDDITGVVHVRDVYRQLAAGRTGDRLGDLARSPMFVPPSRSCAELLTDFRSRRVHLGIVADEFGGTDGLVTLEDVIEELVGEIHDETDVDEEELERIGEHQVVCAGGIDLRDVEEALGIAFPKGEHRSLNGLILGERGRVPERGASLEIGEVRIDILGRTDARVTRAQVTRLVSDQGSA